MDKGTDEIAVGVSTLSEGGVGCSHNSGGDGRLCVSAAASGTSILLSMLSAAVSNQTTVYHGILPRTNGFHTMSQQTKGFRRFNGSKMAENKGGVGYTRTKHLNPQSDLINQI